MSSATISKMTFSTAFVTLEEAVAGLESATAVLVESTTRENGAPFSRVRAVWEVQKRLSEACKVAPTTGGDNLWPRVTAAKKAAEKALAKSRRFHQFGRRREIARLAHEAKQAFGRPEDSAGVDHSVSVLDGHWEFGGGGNIAVVTDMDGVVHAG